MCTNSFLRQDTFLRSLLSHSDTAKHLSSLRKCLIQPNHLRFYLCTDLSLLNANPTFSEPWTRHFPASLHFDTLPLFSTANKSAPAFKVSPVWKLKKSYEANLAALDLNTCRVFSQMPKRDFVVGLGTSESAYLRLGASIDINSYAHENYAGLLVLIEYFCQTEGPLWEAVRGPGLGIFG